MSYNHCLNCSSNWEIGTEEFDWQVCSSCGWRPGDPIDEDDDEDDDWNDVWDSDETPTKK